MKKKNIIIAAALVFLVVFISTLAVHFSKKNAAENVFEGENIQSGVDDYLMNQKKEKAAGKSNALIVRDNEDFPFASDSEAFDSAVAYLQSSVFDRIFIENSFFSGGEGNYRENLQRVTLICEKMKESGKQCFLFVSDSLADYQYKAAALVCDGFIVTSAAEEQKLVRIRKAVGEEKEFLVYLSSQQDSFSKELCDGILFLISDKKDCESFLAMDSLCAEADISSSCVIDLEKSEKKKRPSYALELLMELSKAKALESRCMSSYSQVRKNYQGSFSAVKKYITSGIVPELTLRELSITGYDGQALETNELTAEFELCGSDIFPVYLDGKKISLGERGSKKITLDLDIGENEFVFTQNGKKITYKITMNFSGEIIRAVIPLDEVVAYPGEEINILTIAHSSAKVTVKLGTKEYKAHKQEKSAKGYTAFVAKAKMPSSFSEVASLGMITVIGSLGEVSEQKKGALIVAAEEPVTEPTTAPAVTENQLTTELVLENFIPELENDEYAATNPPTTQGTTVYTPYVGDQMCIVTAEYADTRPIFYNDDTYDPSYSTLVRGTVDYVENEAVIYNDDEEEDVTYYELSSGVRVKADHVQLTARQNMGQNELRVLSSHGDRGSLKIRLSTKWKVPYKITHTPQNYFSAYTKKYNLSSFTADYIEIVFYHTASAQGEIDTSVCNVISGASWYKSASGNEMILRMPLAFAGKYYGCSFEYNSGGELEITIHNRPQGLNGALVLLDAGHGGVDSGALGIGEQVKESDVNIALTYIVRDRLREMGATVQLTRQGNESLSIDQRKSIVYSAKPDLFVSIHCNGSPKNSDIGTSVYYYKGFSLSLAENIYSQLGEVFRNNLYPGRQELYSQLLDGTRYYPFGVLRVEDCPSVLIETGYMTNDEECFKLIETENIRLLGNAIAQGIAKTLTQ